MVRDGTDTAVLDRFEGADATIRREADGESHHRDGTVTVEGSDTELVAARYDPATTEDRRTAARGRGLSTRPDDDPGP